MIEYTVKGDKLILEKGGTYFALTPDQIQEVKDILWENDIRVLKQDANKAFDFS